MRRLVIGLVSLFALAGCNRDYAAYTYLADPEPVVESSGPESLSVAVGAAVAIKPFIVHPEVEGSSSLPVDEARSSDTTIASVATTTQEFEVGLDSGRGIVVIGKRAGVTQLRLYRSGSEAGTLDVHVVAQ
jgi:Prokaryotic membrane lipoprotein lipid attachment site